MVHLRTIPFALITTLVLAACTRTPTHDPGAVPPSSIVINANTVVLRHGAIGVPVPKQGPQPQATFVYVEVENRAPHDAVVAVDGELIFPQNHVLGPLSIDELRIPMGDKRVFSLVFDHLAPKATARVKLRRAVAIHTPPPVVIASIDFAKSQSGSFATCRITNTLQQPVVATVITAFYNGDGAILARPFTILELLPQTPRTFRFDGPATATRAIAYIGDVLQ